ncbi:hypothetical protein [Nocardia sp. NPDC051750]|uniref:hypothetical protein n=1 Tax=Nocardia sp. NPDC051750 TaxID=3364325 RepID=UPI0037ADE4C9
MFAPVLSSESSTARLADFAFGARPTRSAAELPEPRNCLEMWWQAVALGGAGHYAAARVVLRRLSASTTDPVLLSLAASTEGSFLRQLGRHARAAHADGRAAVLVLPRLSGAHVEPPGPARSGAVDRGGIGTTTHDTSSSSSDTSSSYSRVPDLVDAAADAMIGLAADALGTGRLAVATRLLDRCTALLRPAARPPAGGGVPGPDSAGTERSRALVRLHWVRAETALASGRGADAAVEAGAALTLAESGPSIRHQVKSRLLVAAATSVTGEMGRAAELAVLVDDQCRVSGLLPLRWACAMLRTGLAAPGVSQDSARADAEACRALITQRGGRFHDSGH